MRCPVLLDRSEAGIEKGTLDAVSPNTVTGCHQEITPTPGVIGDITSFVAIERSDAAIDFTRRRDAIDQHVMIEDALLRGEREAQMFTVPGMGIEDGRQLGFFDVSHSVSIDRSIREDSRRMEIAGLVISGFRAFEKIPPRLLGHRQQLPVARASVSPEHRFHVGHVAQQPWSGATSDK